MGRIPKALPYSIMSSYIPSSVLYLYSNPSLTSFADDRRTLDFSSRSPDLQIKWTEAQDHTPILSATHGSESRVQKPILTACLFSQGTCVPGSVRARGWWCRGWSRGTSPRPPAPRRRTARRGRRRRHEPAASSYKTSRWLSARRTLPRPLKRSITRN